MDVRLKDSESNLELLESHLLKLLLFTKESCKGDGKLSNVVKEVAKRENEVPECYNQHALRHMLPLKIRPGMGNCRECHHDGQNKICAGYNPIPALFESELSYAELM